MKDSRKGSDGKEPPKSGEFHQTDTEPHWADLKSAHTTESTQFFFISVSVHCICLIFPFPPQTKGCGGSCCPSSWSELPPPSSSSSGARESTTTQVHGGGDLTIYSNVWVVSVLLIWLQSIQLELSRVQFSTKAQQSLIDSIKLLQLSNTHHISPLNFPGIVSSLLLFTRKHWHWHREVSLVFIITCCLL